MWLCCVYMYGNRSMAQGLWADRNAGSLTDKQLDDLTLLLEQVGHPGWCCDVHTVINRKTQTYSSG